MTAAVLAGALAQCLAVGVVGWGAGNILLAHGKVEGRWIGGPERWLLRLVGFVLFSTLLMLLHIVTGGAVFGLAPVVPIMAIGVLLWGFRCRPRSKTRIEWLPLAALAVVLVALYAMPAIKGGSSLRTGDPPWHLGWTQQLLAGEPIPTGPAPLYARDAYPWGLHAVAGTMVRLVPGTDPLVALEALHLLLIAALPLAAACMARLASRKAGWAAACAMGLVGGFGWLTAYGPTFVTSPGVTPYGADIVVASPNSLYELFPPALPRELGLVLLAAATVLLVIALDSGDRRAALVAGVATGLVGLVSVPMFLNAVAWVVTLLIVQRRRLSLRVVGTLIAAAAVTFGLWAGPVLRDYFRFGGFVNITPRLGFEWPLPTALWSWGLLLPAAIAGLIIVFKPRAVHRPTEHVSLTEVPSSDLLRWLPLATAVLLALSIARSVWHWNLAGNATLLHQGRIWPPAHLLGAALAGIAAVKGFGWVRERWGRVVAGGLAAVVLGAGVASPALASAQLTQVIHDRKAGFLYGDPDVGSGSFVRRAASFLGPDNSVFVDGVFAKSGSPEVDTSTSNDLAFLLFEFSGCRLAAYDDPRLNHNDLRIRFADEAARWDAAQPFDADYEVLHEGDSRASGQDVLASGSYGGQSWVLIEAPAP